ncbi:ribosome biogenesis GTPase Der [Acidobacteria bacterium AH-259-G07]|nr:ribosome biogenesis GTPase Der [Acidobacteria bacterium AH-259-G07]
MFTKRGTSPLMYRVAIIGRPNVGKSTLFNRLTGTRKAIVGNEPGITRDRLFEIARWNGKQFEVIDTGGLIPDERETISEKVLQQVEIAMEEADLLLFVVDVRDGIIPLDQTLNSILRSRGKEYLVVVNKVDVPQLEQEALQFYALGVEILYFVSAEHKQGVSVLVEEILRRVSDAGEINVEEEIRVAIIGRPNVGKSSLLNRFLGKERAIVAELPGTTRDAVDSLLRFEDRSYRLIDTAGIRHKGKRDLKSERLSVVMARKNLERTDVALLVVDAAEGPTKLDATIGGYAHKAGKSIIVVINKWDLIRRDTHTAAGLEKEFRVRMRFLEYVPMIFVSAKTGQRVVKIFELVQEAYSSQLIRVPTAELNQFLVTEVQPLLMSPGSSRKFAIKYAAQVGVAPPTFVLFTRSSRKLHFSTQRFLINRLREKYGFYATPIRILQRASRKKM